MKSFLINLLSVGAMCTAVVNAQTLSFSVPHGFYDNPFEVTVTNEKGDLPAEATIRYTLDGSEPSASSNIYTAPIAIGGNTILRVAALQNDSLCTPVATATYLFLDDVLNQPDAPAGYPMTWGEFCTIPGTAPADYGMDQTMTHDAKLAPKIREGFKSLPVLSIVTDKENLFCKENDSIKGGIYIYTGAPVGDEVGHGWTRQANVEMFGMEHDMNAPCGLRLHGGHGRLAEKNPKHSFRLVFKKEYGQKNLKYPIFGENEPSTFGQLVLRCHFGNAWQHWMTSNHQKAQYTRDVWARRMQRQLGWTSANALYVHLFLNGMYWGMYNIAERIDDQYGKDHLDTKKENIDVIKVEESGGNHLEASEGDMEAWNLMVATAAQASDDAAYYRLQGLDADGQPSDELEALLDIDDFIDYMLINQYGGNGDWDHHNWYAIRKRGEDSEGYRFICWDSELILESANANVLDKNNGNSYPTGIFNNLLANPQFAKRYLRRAKELLADDGMLGPKSAEALWDSLYQTISLALYDEAARWGDYRRDVHPYSSRGARYTVDETYMTERRRMHNEVFPYRSERTLSQIIDFLNIDDFDAPEGWTPLAKEMFHKWDGSGADAQPYDSPIFVDWNLRTVAGGGTAIAGFANVDHDTYADISDYEKLVIFGSGSNLRILTNRLVAHGDWKEMSVSFNEWDPYWDAELGAIVVPVQDIKTMINKQGKVQNDSFVHLCALKVDWGASVNVRSIYLVGSTTGIEEITSNGAATSIAPCYNLFGQKVVRPASGIMFIGGKKMIVK